MARGPTGPRPRRSSITKGGANSVERDGEKVTKPDGQTVEELERRLAAEWRSPKLG